MKMTTTKTQDVNLCLGCCRLTLQCPTTNTHETLDARQEEDKNVCADIFLFHHRYTENTAHSSDLLYIVVKCVSLSLDSTKINTAMWCQCVGVGVLPHCRSVHTLSHHWDPAEGSGQCFCPVPFIAAQPTVYDFNPFASWYIKPTDSELPMMPRQKWLYHNMCCAFVCPLQLTHTHTQSRLRTSVLQ